MDQLLEASLGEVSENNCKEEIINTYIEYLSDEDKKIFNQN